MTNLASCLVDLTPKERLYVENRLQGLGKVASARGAGYADAAKNATRLEKNKKIQEAMVAGMHETAQEVGFTRKDAHDMLYSAYLNAATATEQVMAVRAMVDLHGIAVPKKIEVEHKHEHNLQLEHLETAELLKMANMDGLTLEGEYEVVYDDDNPMLEHDK